MWIFSNQRKRFRSSLFEEHTIADQLRGPKFRDAPLSYAEKFSGAADPKIFLGNLKTVGRTHQRFQSFPRWRRGRGVEGYTGKAPSIPTLYLFTPYPPTPALFHDKQTIRCVCPASYTASQLMQLRHSESIGMFNQHDRGVRHINPDFN